MGLLDLIASERGTWCLLLLVVVLLLVAWRVVDGNAALAFLMQVTTLLVAAKTATGYIEAKHAKES